MLGYGSGGTVVLQGRLDGRPVAVKRLLARFAELARTEINALIHTDDHPNVVSVRSCSTAASMMFLGAPCAAMPSRGMIWQAFSRCCGPFVAAHVDGTVRHTLHTSVYADAAS